MDIQEAIQPFATQPLTHQLLFSLLKEYKRPNDKINDLLEKGQLIRLKRGVYIWRSAIQPELFSVANVLSAPSYVSAESALSYWEFIPERVFTVVSIAFKSNKNFTNELGTFTYRKVSQSYYPFGIKRVQLYGNQFALIASPEKALMDKVVTTSGLLLRSASAAKSFLVENLRIDEDHLKTLNTAEMRTWLPDTPKKTSLDYLIKAIEQL